MRNALLLLTALLVMVAVNFGIYQREQQLRDGRVVLLELAPVDPRSLMQGDYMALRFAIANQSLIAAKLQTLTDGCLVATLDARNVATFSRHAGSAPLADHEVLLRYRIRNGQVRFATNAFFFQEGHAKAYEAARFGEFRVAADGELLLIRLLDQDLMVLGETR